MVAYLYTYDGILVPMRAARLQRVFGILMDLIYRVDMRTNVGNTASIACQTFRAIGGHSEKAYELHMMGGGLTHKEERLQGFCCPDRDVDLEVEFLLIHH